MWLKKSFFAWALSNGRSVGVVGSSSCGWKLTRSKSFGGVAKLVLKIFELGGGPSDGIQAISLLELAVVEDVSGGS
jgi:hypothetical protein